MNLIYIIIPLALGFGAFRSIYNNRISAKPAAEDFGTVSVTTAKAERRDLVQNVRLTGKRRAKIDVPVICGVPCKVYELRKNAGDAVSAGEIIAILDVPSGNYPPVAENYIKLEAALSEAAVAYETDKNNPDINISMTAVMTYDAVKEQYDAFMASEAAQFIVYASESGKIADIRVKSGEILLADDSVICRIIDDSIYYADFLVTGQIKDNLHEGEILTMHGTANGSVFDNIIEAKIVKIGSDAEPLSLLYPVTAELTGTYDKNQAEKSDNFETDFILNQVNAMCVPYECILYMRDKKYVYKVEGSRHILTEVGVGQISSGYAEILSGLSLNEIIIKEGKEYLTPVNSFKMR